MMKKIDITLKISNMLILLIIGLNCANAQQKIDSLKNYTFEYLGGCDKHLVNRLFLTDSTFVEKATITYLGGSYSVTDTFMIGKNEWFYKNNGQWLPYFSKFSFQKKRKTYIFGAEKMIPSSIATPSRLETIDNREIYVYRIESKNDVSANLTEYYFDFELGVVKIVDTGLAPQCREITSSLLGKN